MIHRGCGGTIFPIDYKYCDHDWHDNEPCPGPNIQAIYCMKCGKEILGNVEIILPTDDDWPYKGGKP